MSLQSEWQRCAIHQEIHRIHGKLQQDAPLLDHLELLFQQRPTLSNVGQPIFLRFLIQMAIDWGLHRYPLFIQDFILCYIVLSTFLDRHGQNMDKFNRSQLPNCQSVLRQVTLAAGSGGSTEAFVAFVAVAFVLVVFAASQRTSEEAKVGVSLWDPYAT